jgi:hypothetical protein
LVGKKRQVLKVLDFFDGKNSALRLPIKL